MPRFYFDIDDDEPLPDQEGSELEGLNAARIEAVRLSGEILKDAPDRFWSVGEWRCTVRDENRAVLFVLHFKAVEVAAEETPT